MTHDRAATPREHKATAPASVACYVLTVSDTKTPATDSSGSYQKNSDGTYVCNPDTVPGRVLAYRKLNGLPAGAPVPALLHQRSRRPKVRPPSSLRAQKAVAMSCEQ